ncbi:hypothetical protein [Chamaesiphon polymorphus]|nr:hypothetical protein [Chamaesiphon polymorphus]
MKRFLPSGLIVIAISLAVNTSVAAKGKSEVITKPVAQATNSTSIEYITPFELVGNAYQGQYRKQSIPGFGSFIYDVKTGKVTAKDLVEAAIVAKVLPSQAIADRNYLSNVDWQLRSLDR